MAAPIQVRSLGLLAPQPAYDPNGVMPYDAYGLVPPPATPPRRAPSREAPARGQGLFAGLFNTGDKPSGYTPEDVQKIIGDRASYYQNFPIVPQWNGGKGAGGILPGIANFGSGFMGAREQGRQQGNAQDNERIRREASDTASQATTLEDAVRALQSGSPEQSNTALRFRLESLVKDRERERQAAIMQQVYGAPGGATAPAQAAPTQGPQSPTAPAQTAPPAAGNEGLLPFPLPPLNIQPEAGADPPLGMPPTLMQEAGAPPVQPPQSRGAAPGVPLPGGIGPTPPAALRSAQPSASQAPAQPAQPEAVVEIGGHRFPIAEARRRAALGRAQGIDVKPLEEAIQLAEVPLQAAARERGKALGDAQTGLPQSIQAAQSTIEKIDEIANDPQLERIIGWSAYNPGSYLPYTPEQRGLVARVKQVQGRFFLQAFDALRGGGQITEKEGEKAQEAIARIMDVDQDMRSYRVALEDARREVWSLTNIARTRAGLGPVPYTPAPPAVGSVRDGYRFNGGNPADPSSWQRAQ